jgi:hypothetical protein
MKMLLIVTDSEYSDRCLSTLSGHGVSGYTVIPEAFGAGRTGSKMGDRAHPGASTVVFAAIPDERAPALMACVRECIDRHGLCESTHAWVLPIEYSL